MRTTRMLTVAVAVVAGTVAVGIRSATAMAEKPAQGDTRRMTYTGCVESVNHGYAFLLAKVDVADSMHRDMAAQQHDGMAAQQDQSTMPDPKMDAMSSKSFGLAGSADFSRHVGQRVTVTGTVADPAPGTMRQDVPTLTVKSLKVIARSCS